MMMKNCLTAILILAYQVLSAQGLVDGIKLFRYGPFENEKPAVEYADGTRLDVKAFGEDYTEQFFATDGISRLITWLSQNAARCKRVPLTERFGSCIARPSKLVAIGLNYADHVKEGPGQGVATPLPREPIIFFKSTTAMCGPFDPVIIPKNAQKLDWEVELAVVISKKASYVSEADALQYVAGYTVINDYSEREWQLQKDGGQWDKGKGADRFAPVGPYLILAQQIKDPQNLKLWLKVNGEKKQSANTKDMIFSVAKLISYTSHHMTLLPGDIIATGTPSGVGSAQKPPVYLKEGDEVELSIEQIGTQKQTVISYLQSQLTSDEWKDYKAWVALGVGGLPHTIEGFRTVQAMNARMGNPLDVSRIAPLIGTPLDKSFLKKLPLRVGIKPMIAPYAIPHRQTDQHNDTLVRAVQTRIFDAQIASNPKLLHYQTSGFERNNKAIFLKDTLQANAAMIKSVHGEVGHIHPSDGSMHITYLSPSDAKKVIESGWGEFHGLAGDGRLTNTYMMLYAPRDEKELLITKQILEAAIKYAKFIPKTNK